MTEKTIAHIATTKNLSDAIKAIKTGEPDWKKIFIQYKSRVEKKRNWREKQKLYKEMENTIQAMKTDADQPDGEEKTENVDKLSVDANDDEDDANDDDDDEDDNDVTDEEVDDVPVKGQLKNKAERLKILLDAAHCNTIDDDTSDISNGSNGPGSDLESGTDEQGDNSFGSMEKDQSNSSTCQNKGNCDETKAEKKPWSYMPDKSKNMVIKQINLKELQHLDEIPIGDEKEAGDDDDTVDLSTNDRNPKKLKKDPFFLGENGEEFSEDETEKHTNHQWNQRINDRYSYSRNYDQMHSFGSNRGRDSGKPDLGRDDSRRFPNSNSKRRSMVESSFTNSLSYTDRKKSRFDQENNRKTSNDRFSTNRKTDFRDKERPYQKSWTQNIGEW